jgi:hypothetical protein
VDLGCAARNPCAVARRHGAIQCWGCEDVQVLAGRFFAEGCFIWNLEHVLFFNILGRIIPTDYFSEGLKPPTSDKDV